MSTATQGAPPGAPRAPGPTPEGPGKVLRRYDGYALVAYQAPGRDVGLHLMSQEYAGTSTVVGVIEETPAGWVARIDYGTERKRVPMVARETIGLAFAAAASHFPYAASDLARREARERKERHDAAPWRS